MKVLKVTTAEGREYFARIHDAVERAEIIEMPDDHYQSIPATQDADQLFGEAFRGQ
jgi:hypothetical protein